jgi:hypothetical protein
MISERIYITLKGSSANFDKKKIPIFVVKAELIVSFKHRSKTTFFNEIYARKYSTLLMK